ncbi:group 1 truncated hemoglobin [Dactylosporangium salmoneum]|uniref:Group 1 truncated hemoglobin n=1 Tax=Dactylosporangium salmoneum TaxID=53361 RepID=A0ABP5SW74_9ACTN
MRRCGELEDQLRDTDVDIQRLKTHQRAFIAAALGGPQIFAGRDMAAAHAGLDITDADFDAVVAHLAGTLTDLGVADEQVAQIGAALAPLRGQIVTKTDSVVAS